MANPTNAMSQMVDNSSSALLLSEILDKVHKAKTKADKLKRGAAQNTLLKIKRELENHNEVSVQLFSSLKNTGVVEAQNVISSWLEDEEG